MLERLNLNNSSRAVVHFVVGDGFDREEVFEMNPPYQRGSVWTVEQRVALIKSLFMGLPIGAIVVNNRGYDSEKVYAVVDGKQRMETLRAFSNNEFAVPAEWFDRKDVLTPFVDDDGVEKVFLKDLDIVITRRFNNFPVASIEASVKTVAEEAELFGLLNSAGTSQTTEDLNKAEQIAKGK